MSGGSAEWITQGCDASLARLGTDYIDLYLLHFPDANTPIADTLEAFGKLVAAGKVREIGCSNFTGAMIEEAEAAAKDLGVPAFVNAQNDYSLLDARSSPTCSRCASVSASRSCPTSRWPSGVLTGKYKRGEAPRKARASRPGARWRATSRPTRRWRWSRSSTSTRAHGHSLHELALSWLAGHPAVASVIAGATSPEQVRGNAAATTAWQLTAEERRTSTRSRRRLTGWSLAPVADGAVAVVELSPGPLADIGGRAVRAGCSPSSTTTRADPPRRCLLLRPKASARPSHDWPHPSGCRIPPRCWPRFRHPPSRHGNGPAIGAGAEVLLAADVRVAGPDATMGFPEVGAGELPCWGGTQRLTRAGGVALALRMLVIGGDVDIDVLERSGLAQRADDAIASASDLAARLAAGAPRAQAAAREAVQRGRDLTLADALRLESDLNLLLSTTADRAEGIAAFFDKRAPKFTGD